MHIKIGGMKLICLAVDRDQWRAIVKGGNEISASIKRVLSKRGTVLSWSTTLHLESFHTAMFCVWLTTGKVKSCTTRFFEGDACILRGSHSKIPVVPTFSVWWGILWDGTWDKTLRDSLENCEEICKRLEGGDETRRESEIELEWFGTVHQQVSSPLLGHLETTRHRSLYPILLHAFLFKPDVA